MNETQINAIFQSLQQQNQALSGQLAEAHGQIAVMKAALEEAEKAEEGVEAEH